MSIIKVDYGSVSGGGASDSGTFTLPLGNTGSPITVALPFTPSFVEVKYDAITAKSASLMGNVTSDGAFSLDVYNSSINYDRLVLGLTTNGFTVEFSATNAGVWNYTDAEYIAYA